MRRNVRGVNDDNYAQRIRDMVEDIQVFLEREEEDFNSILQRIEELRKKADDEVHAPRSVGGEETGPKNTKNNKQRLSKKKIAKTAEIIERVDFD